MCRETHTLYTLELRSWSSFANLDEICDRWEINEPINLIKLEIVHFTTLDNTSARAIIQFWQMI